MKTIEEVFGKDYTFVDVRSPKEFAEDHIPGAINIPLFDNEERAIVGTLYTKTSREAAIDKGLEIFSEKLPDMVKKYKELKQAICIYCWRGGMRSRAVVSLLKSIGFDVIQLERGYKDYRRYVREQLAKVKIPPMIILYGLTGSGKTEILEQLNNSLDLEGLAEHRGSIYGDIHLNPNSQKMFESLLLKRLIELRDEERIFVEGESRRIGRILITDSVWASMQKATKVKVISPIEERVERIHRIYCDNFNKEKFSEKTMAISKHIGKKKAEEIVQLIQAGRIKEFIEMILLEYYDKLYAHTVDTKEYAYEIKNKEDLENIFSISLPQKN